MIRVFDFRCPNGHVSEHFLDWTPKEGDLVECPVCGEKAVKLLAAPRFDLEGFSGAFPTAADQWEKRRESHMAVERKNQEKHGTYK